MLLRFPSTARKVSRMPSDPQKDVHDNPSLSCTSPLAPITVLAHPQAPIRSLEDAAEQARKYVVEAKAQNTRRAYATDWRMFVEWCVANDLQALPASPETVVLYVTILAQSYKVSTIDRRLTAISQAHQAARLDPPTKNIAVATVMSGIRRTLGTAQDGKAPALVDDVRAMVAGLPNTRHGLQQRALLLLGFAGAFRRSELVALDVADFQFTRAGLVVTIRRSKTDQTGEGMQKGIPNGSTADTCPVRAVKAWLKAANISSGPVFRPVNRADEVQAARLADQAVARAVKRGAERAGLDPSLYAGHSLRAGLATSAAAAGVEERLIAKQTGHKSMTVLRRYIREGSLFNDNAAGKVGL